MPSENRMQDVEETAVEATYERPKLVVLGNLRDLLAGGGSLVCDGTLSEPGHGAQLC
jgi:hypothetical protein